MISLEKFKAEFYNGFNQSIGTLRVEAVDIDAAVSEINEKLEQKFIPTMDYGKDIKLRNVIVSDKVSRYTVSVG